MGFWFDVDPVSARENLVEARGFGAWSGELTDFIEVSMGELVQAWERVRINGNRLGANRPVFGLRSGGTSF